MSDEVMGKKIESTELIKKSLIKLYGHAADLDTGPQGRRSMRAMRDALTNALLGDDRRARRATLLTLAAVRAGYRTTREVTDVLGARSTATGQHWLNRCALLGLIERPRLKGEAVARGSHLTKLGDAVLSQIVVRAQRDGNRWRPVEVYRVVSVPGDGVPVSSLTWTATDEAGEAFDYQALPEPVVESGTVIAVSGEVRDEQG